MKIVCRYRKTISMSRVYDLERLISSCSDSDSELSSLYEDETACIRRDACTDELTSVPTKSPTSETKDLLDTQPRNPSAELQETLIESQDYIQNDQESLLTVLNDGNLEEYLQR